MDADDRYRLFESARVRAELSVHDLWLRYLALGGSGDVFDVDGYLHGLLPLEPFQQDVLAQALNERLDEVYRAARVPLSWTPPGDLADDVLHRVITELLRGRPSTTEDRSGPRDEP